MFAFELALRLGKTIAEIDALTAEEYTYWQAFLRLRPHSQ